MRQDNYKNSRPEPSTPKGSGPGETYLQLEQVDLESPGSILGFVNKYGPLGGWFAYHGLRTEAQNRVDDPTFYFKYWSAFEDKDVWQIKRDAVMQLATLPANKRISSKTRDGWRQSTTDRLVHQLPPVVETLDEFRFAAKLLADLKAAWVAVRAGETTLQGGDPAHFLTDFLGRLLRPFSPTLGLEMHFFPPEAPIEALFAPPGETIIEPRRRLQRTPLHAICALELFNHMSTMPSTTPARTSAATRPSFTSTAALRRASGAAAASSTAHPSAHGRLLSANTDGGNVSSGARLEP